MVLQEEVPGPGPWPALVYCQRHVVPGGKTENERIVKIEGNDGSHIA